MTIHTFVGDEAPQAEAASFIDLISETTDGYLRVAVQTDREWEALARALERPKWLADERFGTAALRQQHIGARLALIQEVLATRSTADWLQRLEAEGVPCAPVLTRSAVVRHAQLRENEVICETEHPIVGRIRQARPAARFSRTPASIRIGAPRLGEHTEAVRREIGYSAAEIAALLAEKAIAG